MRRPVPVVLLVPALTLAGFLAPPPGAGQSSFADPRGRYRVDVPAGWTANSLSDDAVSLTGRGASVTVMVTTTPDAGQVLDGLVGQYQGQWADLVEIKRGEQALAGAAGRFVFAGGRNPRGVAAFVKIVVAPHGDGSLVLLESAPQEGYAALRPVLEKIEAGVTAGGAPATAAPGGPAFLGLGARAVEPGEARSLGLEGARGALVGQVLPGGPADRGGLVPGDVILAVDDAPLEGPEALVALVGRHRPGDVLTLQVLRQRRPTTVRVALTARPSS